VTLSRLGRKRRLVLRFEWLTRWPICRVLPVSSQRQGLMLRAHDSAAVRRLIAELPEPFREVIVLREISDLSYREIAEITGVPVGTVMSRLARARAMLRSAWNAMEGAAAAPSTTDAKLSS